MRIILDECIPRPLGPLLTGHDVSTVQKQGWSATTNGALLRLIDAAAFEAFITMDKSLPQQQALRGRSFGTVILKARSNKLDVLALLVSNILSALATLRPGEVVVVQ